MPAPANLPYMYKHADFTLDDPGDAGFIGCNPKGKATVYLRTAGSETRTLRAPDHDGDELTLCMAADGGDCVVTVLDSAGSTTDTLTFANVLDIAVLSAVRTGAGNGTLTWVNRAGSGSVSASSATFTTLTVNTTATLASAILQFTGTTGTSEVELADNLADALSIKIASGADILVVDTSTNAVKVTAGDNTLLGLGTGATARLSWDTTDANANELLLQLPAGGATDVPVLVIGQSIESVDLGLYNGVTEPRIAIFGVGAVTTGPVFEFRKARGTVASPTVVTSGDDIGRINFHGAVAAGEYVLGASIEADMAGTIGTTRGPGTLTFKTATDAAPSVLTTALTISAAQLVTVAAGLTVTSGTITVTSGNLDFTVASDILVAANTAAALEFSDGTNKVLVLDTRNTVKDVANVKINAVAPTIATAAEVQLNPSLQVAAKTLTYTGTNTITSSYGVGMHIGIPTFTSAAAGTISAVSNLHVAAVAAAGGSLTLTASYMISTGVSDCFLTNAGVWTDTSCFADGKLAIVDATKEAIAAVLGKLKPKSWTYRSAVHGNDFGRDRLGVVYDDLPGELRAPGQEKAVSAGVLGSFALAALKMLFDENRELKARLELLEAA